MKHDETYYTSRFAEAIGAVARVQRGDASAADAVIRFLEADPFAMGTGYLKQAAWKFLRRVELNESEIERLRKVALEYLRKSWSHEFYAMCKAIPRWADAKLAEEVMACTNHPDQGVVHRATVLAAYLQSYEKGEELRERMNRDYFRVRQEQRAYEGRGKKPGKPRWTSRP